MSRRFALLLLLVSALAGCGLAGCGPENPPARAASHVDPGRRIRLIDRLGDADLTSAVDLTKVTDPDQIDDARLIDRMRVEGIDLQGPDAALFRAAAEPGTTQLGADPDLAAGDILAYAFPASPGSLIRCTMTAAVAAGARLEVDAYECDSLDRARPIASRPQLEQVLADRLSFRAEMLVKSEEDGEQTWTVTIPARFTTGAVLVVTRVIEGTATIRRVEKARYPRGLRAVFKPRPSLPHPHARRITWNGDARESIMIAAPGRLRLTIADPPQTPQLTLSLAAFDTGDATVRAKVTQGVHIHEQEWTVPEVQFGVAGFHPISWPIETSETGRPLTIDVEITSSRPDGWVALANPTLSSARDEAAPLRDHDPRPDVILISLDTVRADRLSPYGGDDTCPNLARLATSSVVFDRAIAAAPWTLPSHASIFTGQLTDHHRVDDPGRELDPDTAPLVTTAFRGAGYETAAFTGGGFVRPEFGFATGFERYTINDPANDKVAGADAMDAFLGSPAASPRFVFVHTYAAHEFSAIPEDLARVGLTEADLIVARETLSLPQDELVEHVRSHPDRAAIEEIAKKLYDAGLIAADRVLGRVIAAQEARGRLDETLLVVLSDHGQELFDHGWIGHGRTLFQEQLRVPLIIRGPGLQARRIPQVTSLIDIAPTLREWLGLPHDPTADGRSLMPLLTGGQAPPIPAMASIRDADGLSIHALRNKNRKAILTAVPGEEAQLSVYDLRADPREIQPLTGPPDAERLRRILIGQIKRLRELPGAGYTRVMDANVEEELRQLGYLGDG